MRTGRVRVTEGAVMPQAGESRQSFYKRKKAAELRSYATENWNDARILLEIVRELGFRSSRASSSLRDQIIERLVEISAELGKPAPTTSDLGRRSTAERHLQPIQSPLATNSIDESVTIPKPVPEPEQEPVLAAEEQPTVLKPQPAASSLEKTIPAKSGSSGGWFWGLMAVLIIFGLLWISGKNTPRGAGVTDTFKKTVLDNGDVHVDGYVRQNGKYVAPHARTPQNATTTDNFSTKGNVNFYTGQPGTK
jgi:hypothetical protein